ncbi:hypothetical protein M3Y99_01465200 [Aphelenchoides fujianensis]|nr:hypothetical protein M3Y99_01465200 [Aphelenchoides fujianensis]
MTIGPLLRLPLLLLISCPSVLLVRSARRRDIMWASSENDLVQHQQPFYAHTAKCFSCMSKFYEAVWPALAHVYKKPMNFTDDCNDETIDQRLVPITHCPTICVAMSEESTVAGVKIRGFIRGCADDLLINGFNQTIVAWYRWMHRDACRVYGKRELFKLPFEQSDESSIQVCTCYSDFCNVAADHSASLKGRWGALAAGLLATLLAAEVVGGR